VKGLLYLGNIQFHDRVVPGGFAATLRHLPDERVRAFFQQNFLAATFYDLAPVLDLSSTGALLAGQPTWQFVRETARWAAHLRLPEVYKSLLSPSPKAMFMKSPRIVQQYVDFGKVEAVELSDSRGQISNHKIPAFLASWFLEACQGYFTGGLELAGAQNIRIPMATPVESDGVLRGVEAVRATYDVEWS